MRAVLEECKERLRARENLKTAGVELQSAREREASVKRQASVVSADLHKAKLTLATLEAAQQRAEDARSEKKRTEVRLAQMRGTLRNTALEEAVKGLRDTFDVETEILTYQVRRCNKLGSLNVQLPKIGVALEQ